MLDIYEAEGNSGVIVSVGGQIPNNLALPLHRKGVRIYGTSPDDIDRAEDRGKFSALMDSIGVRQPAWSALTSAAAAAEFSARVGYPVLVRPSYVLSGAAMAVVESPDTLAAMLANAAAVSAEHPVVISKFISGAVEVDFDGVADGGAVVAHAISEHVEAGVHSGDATMLLPPQHLSAYTIAAVKSVAAKVARALRVTGPFNMQLLATGGDVLIIEANLRASRSFPFVSKTVGADFIDAATRVMLGHDVRGLNLPALDGPQRPANFVGVKAPMFSFTRLRGADPLLGVEMASTGEVACFGANVHEAFLKSLLAANFKMPAKGAAILVSARPDTLPALVHAVFKLEQLGFKIVAPPATAKYLADRHIAVEVRARARARECASAPVARARALRRSTPLPAAAAHPPHPPLTHAGPRLPRRLLARRRRRLAHARPHPREGGGPRHQHRWHRARRRAGQLPAPPRCLRLCRAAHDQHEPRRRLCRRHGGECQAAACRPLAADAL